MASLGAGWLLPTVTASAPSAAAPGDSALVYVATGNGADRLLVAPSQTPQSARTVLKSERVKGAQLSPDGQRVLVFWGVPSTEDPSAGGPYLSVMNLDGSGFRGVSADLDPYEHVEGFSWLGADAVVFGQLSHRDAADPTQQPTSSRNLYRRNLADRASTALPNSNNLAYPAVSPDGSTIAALYADPADPAGQVSLRTYDVASATLSTTPLDSGQLGQPAWSHDGTHIVFAKTTATNSTYSSAVEQVTRTGGTWSAPVVVASSDDSNAPLANPTFTFDDTEVWFSRADVAAGDRALMSVKADGSQLATRLNGGTFDNPSFGPPDSTAPATPTMSSMLLDGRRTTVRWTRPNDGDYVGAIVTRNRGRSDEKTFQANGNSLLDTTTKAGSTYTYDVVAADAVGNHSGVSAPRRATALNPPLITAGDPTSSSSTTLTFPVSWKSPANPPGSHASYLVRWFLYNRNSTWATLSKGSATSASLRGRPGYDYLIHVRVLDRFGNSSLYTRPRIVTVPLDDRDARFSSGWHAVKSTHAWRGTEHVTTRSGATATITLTSDAIVIIGRKSVGGASFKVYVDGTYFGVVSTAARTTRYRAILWRHNFHVGPNARRLKIVAVVRRGQALHLDAVAPPTR